MPKEYKTSSYDSIFAQLVNSYPNESTEWYEETVPKIIEEQARSGNTTANIINNL